MKCRQSCWVAVSLMLVQSIWKVIGIFVCLGQLETFISLWATTREGAIQFTQPIASKIRIRLIVGCRTRTSYKLCPRLPQPNHPFQQITHSEHQPLNSSRDHLAGRRDGRFALRQLLTKPHMPQADWLPHRG